MYRQLCNDLYGKNGIKKQINAYALVCNRCPSYLRTIVRCIDGAVAALPTARKRELFALHYLQGLRLHQAARLLGMSYNMAAAQLRSIMSDLEASIAFEMGNYHVVPPAERPRQAEPRETRKPPAEAHYGYSMSAAAAPEYEPYPPEASNEGANHAD